LIRALLLLSAGLTGLYLVALGALYLAQDRLIYPRPPHRGDVTLAGFETVRLRTADGLDLVAAYRASRGDRATLVFFHGNGDSLIGAEAAMRSLGEAGYGLLLVEYRGYGGNPGRPREAGLYTDGRAALDWLGARGIAGQRIVLVGNSLGSGIATQLATERPVAGLILISPFTRLIDAVAPHVPFVPVRWLLRDRYDNLAKLRRRKIAMLVLHGQADTVIAAAQGAELAGAVEGARFVSVPGAGHELAYRMETPVAIMRWLKDANGT